MRIWMLGFALVAACGGATTTGLFDNNTDAGTSDAPPASTTTTPGDASTGTTAHDAGADASHSTPTPTPTADAGNGSHPTPPPDAGNEGGPPPSSDDCPNTAAYSYEFSNVAIDAPLCGPTHGDACADPAAQCCYYDYVSNSHVCLDWLDGG